VLERAFRANYGLELQQVFGDVERAVGTYRWAVSQLTSRAPRGRSRRTRFSR
jgi:hypothetical protein